MGRMQIRCHGDDTRFEVLADFVYERYGKSVKYIADVAGGQGVLSRLLNKRYNYVSEVIDPRVYVVKGVKQTVSEYDSEMASYYDLIIGLHPDEATRPVVESAFSRPVIVVPCCNYWDKTRKLGSKAIAEDIALYYEKNGIEFKMETLPMKYPNIVVYTSGKKTSDRGKK
ncbi:MAG: hypothetical protein E7576_07460 [Ruminococcaceae bacterium]|nr:hypothetical protein [Oscillospiraceae bacterium]